MGLKNIIKENKVRKTILKMCNEELDSKIFIQGTEFDRKRKLTKKQLNNIKNDLALGFSIKFISHKYGVSEWVIKYNTDEVFKAHQLELRKGKSKTHTNTFDAENRANYKRYLVKKRKLKVENIVL